jgi:hypothetical protein
MLNMDYYDRNGDKWSIENGDWLTHQSNPDPSGKVSKINFSFRGVIIILWLVTVIIFFLNLS